MTYYYYNYRHKHVFFNIINKKIYFFPKQNLNKVDQENIMKCIEENTERLDLMQRTYELEEKQRQRLLDISLQKKKELEQAQRSNMYDGYSNSTTTDSMLDQEEANRKTLVDEMVKNSTPSNAPIVKVLTNLQGNLPLRKHKSSS